VIRLVPVRTTMVSMQMPTARSRKQRPWVEVATVPYFLFSSHQQFVGEIGTNPTSGACYG
jgi:hypothetical protein